MAMNFDLLWKSHPALQVPRIIDPCTTGGVSNHANQCAIRMGVTVAGAGISLATYRGAFCWSGHPRQHPLRVEQFKLWLDSTDVPWLPYADISKRTRAGVQRTFNDYTGRTGIVALINFWGTGNQGDHIDLWDGSVLASGSRDFFQRSQEIWFWSLA